MKETASDRQPMSRIGHGAFAPAFPTRSGFVPDAAMHDAMPAMAGCGVSPVVKSRYPVTRRLCGEVQDNHGQQPPATHERMWPWTLML